MRLILLGPPGSGKGTSARKLAEKFGVKNVIASNLLRQEYKNGSPDGEKIRSYMDSGNLVPDEITNRILLAYLKEVDGYILDGYPRTRNQAEKLEEKLQENGVVIDRVIYLDVPLDVALARNLSRKTCPNCGYSPSSEMEVCPHCNTKLGKRTDDAVQTIKHRFRTYLELTKPLIDFYSEKGILLTVDASVTIDEVNRSIVSGLED
jgi:adenylate kinase